MRSTTNGARGWSSSDDEMVDSVRRLIVHAQRLGCSVVRVIAMTPPHVVDRCADEAAAAGIKLAVEIHSPHTFEDEWFHEHFASLSWRSTGQSTLASCPTWVSSCGASRASSATGSSATASTQATHYVYADPGASPELMPYVHHVHAKLYSLRDVKRGDAVAGSAFDVRIGYYVACGCGSSRR